MPPPTFSFTLHTKIYTSTKIYSICPCIYHLAPNIYPGSTHYIPNAVCSRSKFIFKSCPHPIIIHTDLHICLLVSFKHHYQYSLILLIVSTQHYHSLCDTKKAQSTSSIQNSIVLPSWYKKLKRHIHCTRDHASKTRELHCSFVFISLF